MPDPVGVVGAVLLTLVTIALVLAIAQAVAGIWWLIA